MEEKNNISKGNLKRNNSQKNNGKKNYQKNKNNRKAGKNNYKVRKNYKINNNQKSLNTTESSKSIVVETNKNLIEANTEKAIVKTESTKAVVEVKQEKNKQELTKEIKKESSLEDSKKVEQKNVTDKKENSSENNIESEKKKNGKGKIIIAGCILGGVIVLSTAFGIGVNNSNKIVNGVSINGINVSNLTKEEATKKIEDEVLKNLNNELELTRGDSKIKVKVSDLNPSIDITNTVENAFNVGRNEGNIVFNNYKIISTFFKRDNVEIIINFDENAYRTVLNSVNKQIPDRVIEANYSVEEGNLIVNKNSVVNRVVEELFVSNLKDAIINNKSGFELPVERYESNVIDIDSIYEEVHKEAKDAYFTTDPYEIHKEEPGVDFSISLEEARQLVLGEDDSYTIPLKEVAPNVTVKKLSDEAFPNVLGDYSTSYATSNYNRSTNVELATRSIDGIVLMPGETFSYNDALGERTAARGYKEAGVYLNGEVTTGYGGGICQVSSTLYNAILLANLEVVDRTNHTFEPSYVPAGQDATVSWGAPEFKFKNNRNYPIKIVAKTVNKRINIEIKGLKTEEDYDVKIESYKIGTIAYSVQYKNDSSLPTGTSKISSYGSNGCKTQTYKILYKDGQEVSRTCISTDTYKPHNQIVIVGTGAAE